RVRALIEQQRWVEARDFATASIMAKPIRQMSYNALGDLYLNFEGVEAAQDYRRELDIDGALSSVRFRTGGALHTREAFVSAIDQVVAVRLTAGPGGVSFTAGFENPPRATAQATGEGRDTLIFAGHNGEQHGVAGALRYETRLRAVPQGGRMSVRDGRLTVTGADSVLLLIAAATSYRSFRDVSGDPAIKTRAAIAQASSKGWDALLSDHQR